MLRRRPNQKLSVSYIWNNKIRGHRRDTPPNMRPDIASLVQTNPALDDAGEVHRHPQPAVFESNFSIMTGRPTTATSRTRRPTPSARSTRRSTTAYIAARARSTSPTRAMQFDNILSATASRVSAGEHLFKGGVQFARLYYDDRFQVLGDKYVEVLQRQGRCRCASSTRRPSAKNIDQRARLLLPGCLVGRSQADAEPRRPLGPLHRHAARRSRPPAGRFIAARSDPQVDAIKQNIAVWRTGVDLRPSATARRRSRRATAATGCRSASTASPTSTRSESASDLPWTDPNSDGIVQDQQFGTSAAASSGGDRLCRRRRLALAVLRMKSRPASSAVDREHPRRRQWSTTAPTATRSARATRPRPPAPTRRSRSPVPNGPGGTVAAQADHRDGLQPGAGLVSGCRTTSSRQRVLPRHRLQGRRVHGQQALLEAMADGGRASRLARTRAASTARGGGQSGDGGPERSQHHGVPERHHRQRLACMPSACRAATVLPCDIRPRRAA